jgi:GNAT superfamily N-acetyltransferase
MSSAAPPAPALAIATIRERPDLVPVVAEWLWDAFWRQDGHSLEETRQAWAEAVAPRGPPQCFVLLADGVAVGTAGLVVEDLEERPDLTPWLASVFVAQSARGRGYAGLLVRAVEAAAREADVATLWLYTVTAERIYARLSWQTAERFDRKGKVAALMRRDLGPGATP